MTSSVDPNLLLLLLLGGFVVMVLLRSSRQRRELLDVQASLAPGAEVMTTSGLHAIVVDVDDEIAVLETGPGQRSRWDRRAIARVVTPAPSAPLSLQDLTDDDTPARDGDATDGEPTKDDPKDGAGS